MDEGCEVGALIEDLLDPSKYTAQTVALARVLVGGEKNLERLLDLVRHIASIAETATVA